jgi:hypothetical protein
MKSKVDSIVRQVLLEKNLSMHFYIRLLSWGLDCLKEIDLDVIGKVKTAELKVDSMGRVKLPCDYVDWVRVGKVSGQHVLRMGETTTFARQLRQQNGVYAPYGDSEYSSEYIWSSPYVQDWFDKNGDFRGRSFGGNGTRTDTFMVLDGEMQVNNNYAEGDTITLDYIGYDQCSASSFVPKYAEGVIRAYMEYKYTCSLPKSSPYDKSSAERSYQNEYRKLVARTNPLDIEAVRRIKDRNFKQTVKL